jgi:hypothetical protein
MVVGTKDFKKSTKEFKKSTKLFGSDLPHCNHIASKLVACIWYTSHPSLVAAKEPFKHIEENQDHDSHASMRHVHPSHHLIITEVLHGNGRITRFDDNENNKTQKKHCSSTSQAHGH